MLQRRNHPWNLSAEEPRFNRDPFTSAQLTTEYILRFECERAGHVQEHEVASADLAFVSRSSIVA